MGDLNTLLSILLSFMTILGTIGGGLIFLFKYGSNIKLTFQELTQGITLLNVLLAELKNQGAEHDKRLDKTDIHLGKIDTILESHEKRFVDLEKKEVIK